MSTTPFEYEERYKVTDLEKTWGLLLAARFVLTSASSQTDHWFIPNNIMSPDEQSHWFDYEKGYAVRIREQVTAHGEQAIITAKQLIHAGDHSTMTNHENRLSVAGVRQVLSSIGSEFTELVNNLRQRKDEDILTFLEVKNFLEQAGRKEYITLNKKRTTFRNRDMQDIFIDLDVIPALQETTLGYSAAIEIEYVGNASPEEARKIVRTASQKLGYNARDVLAVALPGQAIPYLATF